MSARLVVLDGMGLACRAYFASMTAPRINGRGENIDALTGFAYSVMGYRKWQPDFWCLAWDYAGKTFRHALYPEYKAHRHAKPDALKAQLPAIPDVARALGMTVLECNGVEADDLMASLAGAAVRDGLAPVDLVSADKDLLQLAEGPVRVFKPGAQQPVDVWAEWGVEPRQMRDLLALVGDTSDNLPGVRGIGEKGAAWLISEFGNLEAMFAAVASGTMLAKYRQKLGVARAEAFLTRELVTLRTDCELPDWEELRFAPVDNEALGALIERFDLPMEVRV